MSTSNQTKATALDRKQWHPPYFASMRLELQGGDTDSIYIQEHMLNTKPLQLDMVVKNRSRIADRARNEITKLFRKHNIFEFKSPDAELNIDVFYKTIGCACLYKSYGTTVDEIKKDDISLTFIRERKPQKLFSQLGKSHEILQRYPGIYELTGEQLLFPIQFLILKEMQWEKHIWLTALQRNITTEHARRLVAETEKMMTSENWEWADSVLQLAMANNQEIFDKLKEENTMCQALRELMAKEIEEELEKARATSIAEGLREGRREGCHELLNAMKRLKDGESVEAICKSGLNPETVTAADTFLRGLIHA